MTCKKSPNQYKYARSVYENFTHKSTLFNFLRKYLFLLDIYNLKVHIKIKRKRVTLTDKTIVDKSY